MDDPGRQVGGGRYGGGWGGAVLQGPTMRRRRGGVVIRDGRMKSPKAGTWGGGEVGGPGRAKGEKNWCTTRQAQQVKPAMGEVLNRGGAIC